MKKWLSLCIILIPVWVFANDSIVGSAKIRTHELYIGQSFFLDVEVKAPKTYTIEFPSHSPEINGLESIGKPVVLEAIEETQNEKIFRARFPYIAFDSVSGEVGKISIQYIDNKKQSRNLEIDGGSFQILRIPVQTTDALRKAYNPIAPPVGRDWNLFFLIASICIFFAVIIGVFQWLKRRKKLFIPDDIPPREWALAQLSQLEDAIPFDTQKKQWSHLSDVLRLFLEKEWKILAPYLSTGEVLNLVTNHPALVPQLENIASVLQMCDEVKFAQKETTQEEQLSFIQKTRVVIQFYPIAPEVNSKEVDNG